jgi:hypothetical protein
MSMRYLLIIGELVSRVFGNPLNNLLSHLGP